VEFSVQGFTGEFIQTIKTYGEYAFFAVF